MNVDDGNPTTYGGSSSSGSRARPAGTASVLSAYKERVPVHDVCFLDRQPLPTPREDDSTCATVDAGCQRSAVGSETLRKMLEHQPPGLRTVVKNEVHHFKSINGISKNDHVACIPTSLGPRGCVLRPAVFEDEATKKAPFLLSLPFLLHCRSVLHLDPVEGLSLELKRFRHKIPLHIGPTGALKVPLHQFTDSMKAELSHALEQLDNEHDVNELREDRLSRHPSASISPRDPPPPELRRHAVREALPHAEEGGLHRERDGVEPDGSTHDPVVRAYHPRDPAVPPRGSRWTRAISDQGAGGPAPGAAGLGDDRPGPMGRQAFLEPTDLDGREHGGAGRERLYLGGEPGDRAEPDREQPGDDPVLLRSTYSGAAERGETGAGFSAATSSPGSSTSPSGCPAQRPARTRCHLRSTTRRRRQHRQCPNSARPVSRPRTRTARTGTSPTRAPMHSSVRPSAATAGRC